MSGLRKRTINFILRKKMDTTTLKSRHNSVSETYEDSVNKINHWHKRIAIILIFGAAISLFVFVNFFFISPPHSTNIVLEHYHSSMDIFIVGCLSVIVAIYCGLRGREIQASEEVSENDELINEQKRMAGFSLSLFLVSDVIIIFSSSPLWH